MKQGCQRAPMTWLWPRAPRHSPIAAIVLTCGDLDHTLGLLSLRENHPLTVLATETVRAGFVEGNALYGTLDDVVDRVPVQLDQVGHPVDVGGGLQQSHDEGFHHQRDAAVALRPWHGRIFHARGV